jgi:uncharacterized membrane protein
MTSTRNRFQQEAGAVGWLIVMWLTVVVLVGMVLMDVGSIAFTKFRLADVASSASTQAANAYRSSHDLTEACQAAVDQIATEDPAARLAVEGCSIDVPTGVATIKVRKQASTILAGRFDFTKHYTKVTATESNGPSAL